MKKSESESKGKSAAPTADQAKPDKPRPKPAHKVLDRSQKVSNQVNVTNIVHNGPRLPVKHHHKPSTSQQQHHHHPKPNTSHVQKAPGQTPSLPAAGTSQASTHEKKFIPKPKNFNKPVEQQSASNISINLSVDLQTLLNVLPQNQNLPRPYNPPNHQQQNQNPPGNFKPQNKHYQQQQQQHQQQQQKQPQQHKSGKNDNEKPHRVNKQSEGTKVHHKSHTDKPARS
ncbi:probable serine/threonine-protein kinase samkC [Trichogramma pretiosum]|uniref:probable serine/threonine-protein kinase samkC n=1 Tax=Trichogramma pretiosum TaxID=7493 RepID=UPI0006C9C7BE|nr:probable serine/threonine-protein kinase samkC [Trichogramma pretiosum]